MQRVSGPTSYQGSAERTRLYLPHLQLLLFNLVIEIMNMISRADAKHALQPTCSASSAGSAEARASKGPSASSGGDPACRLLLRLPGLTAVGGKSSRSKPSCSMSLSGIISELDQPDLS